MQEQGKLINVMYVVDKLPLGGAEKVTYDLVLHLSPDLFKVSVCCLESEGELGKELKKQGIEIITLLSKKGTDLFLPLRLARLFRKLNVKIVHAHNSTAFKHAAIAAKIVGVPVIIQTRHGDELARKSGWRIILQNKLTRLADKIVCICEGFRQKLIHNKSVDKDKLVVIHNGINVSFIEKNKIGRNQKRIMLGLNADDCVIVNVANIRVEKGQEILIRAFKQVADKEPKAKLLIVGSATDAQLTRALKDLTQGLGLAESVIFLGKREDVSEILSASDIFVLSSLTEGLPISVLEAMAAGIPVVATDVGGIREIIEDGKNGILVPSNSEDKLSAAIVSLLNDKNKAQGLSREGRETVANFFSLEKMIQGYENLYLSLIKEKARNKKILVVGMIPPPIGGMSVYVQEMLNSGLKDRYQFLHFDISKKTTANRSLITGIFYQFYLIFKFIITLAVKNPQIVHIHTCSYFTFWQNTVDVIIAKYIFRRKVILHIHGASFDRFYLSSSRIKKYALKTILKSTDQIIALSEYWREFFEHTVGLENVITVFNGISTSNYQTHYSARWNGMAHGDINILFVGEIGVRKGVFDIEKTVPLISQKTNDFLFTLAGKAPNQYQAKQENRHMQYVGEIAGERKYRYYQNADIFVLPSYAENLPLVILEAMASGLPVVATSVGGIPEIIKDGENGFLIQPGDYRGLAEKITYLIEHPDARKEMGRRNRELAIKQYDFSRVVDDLDRIYQSLIN